MKTFQYSWKRSSLIKYVYPVGNFGGIHVESTWNDHVETTWNLGGIFLTLLHVDFNRWNPRGQIHVDSTCLNWRHFKTPTIHQFSTNWS